MRQHSSGSDLSALKPETLCKVFSVRFDRQQSRKIGMVTDNKKVKALNLYIGKLNILI